MQKWDYKTFVHVVTGPIQTNSDLGHSLNGLELYGQDGWELVTVTYVSGSLVYYFKRPFQPVGERSGPVAPRGS
jgi:hypothetical protein